MKFNLEKSLKEKYSNLLEEIYEFEHHDGWYKLIDDLFEKLEAYLIDYPNLDKIKFVQIKEKFGILRLYAYGGDDISDKMIRETEEKSRTICEMCGSSFGRIRTTNGLWACRCDFCLNKF